MSDNNQTAVAAVTAVPALRALVVAGMPVRSARTGEFGPLGSGVLGSGVLGSGVLGFGTPVLGSEWSLGVAGGSAVGAYARDFSDRTADATVGDLARTTADKATRRIFTHNSTFRGRPRGCPV